jgi:hypothetical protein
MAELTGAHFSDIGILKLILLSDERISSGGDYVQKYLENVCIFMYNTYSFCCFFLNS